MFAGTFIVGIGYLLLSRADNFIAFLVVYIFVISIGASTSFMQATTAGINSWFVRKRGLAMSVNAAAFRLGGAAMVPILSIFVLKYGWQTASIGIGLMMIFLVMPMALFFRRSPEAYGLNPDGDPTPHEDSLSTDGDSPAPIATYDSWTTKEALRTRAFWILSIGTMLRIAAHGTIFVHLIAILDWKDIDRQVAANMVGGLALDKDPVIGLRHVRDQPIYCRVHRRYTSALPCSITIHRVRGGKRVELGAGRRHVRAQKFRDYPRHDGPALQQCPDGRARCSRLRFRLDRHLHTCADHRRRAHARSGRRVPPA